MSQEEEWNGPPGFRGALQSLHNRLRNKPNVNMRELDLLNKFIIDSDFIEEKVEEDVADAGPGYISDSIQELYELSAPRYDDSSDRRVELMEGLLNEFRELGITLPSERGREAKSARKTGFGGRSKSKSKSRSRSRSRTGGRNHKKSKKSKKNNSHRRSRRARRQ